MTPNKPRMSKTLGKAKVFRTNLKDTGNRIKRYQDTTNFKDQRNLVLRPSVKAKRDYSSPSPYGRILSNTPSSSHTAEDDN